MKYLVFIQVIAFLIALLVSRLAIAWPDGFDQYFDVINQQGVSLLISAKPGSIIGEDTPQWAMTLLNYLQTHCQLMITVSGNNRFIISHTDENGRYDPYNLAMVFTVPTEYPPIHIPGNPPPQHQNGDEEESCQQDKSSVESATGGETGGQDEEKKERKKRKEKKRKENSRL